MTFIFDIYDSNPRKNRGVTVVDLDAPGSAIAGGVSVGFDGGF